MPLTYRGRRPVGKPQVLPDVVAYIDYVFLYVRDWPSWLPRKGARHTSGPIRIKADGKWRRAGYFIRLRQPSRSTLLRWSCRQTVSRLGPAREEIFLNRVELAVDALQPTPRDADRVLQQVRRSVFLRFPGKNGFDGSTPGEVQYQKRKGSRANLVSYADKPSKVTGTPCAHVELRRSAQLARRTYGRQIDGLLNLDPRAVFERYIRDNQNVLLPAVPNELSWGASSRAHARVV
jgi:hypothetical protein